MSFNPGTDVDQAAKAAAKAQVAIVFVTQWMSEGMDRPTLSLPDKQDELVEAVAKANPGIRWWCWRRAGASVDAVACACEEVGGGVVSGDWRRWGRLPNVLFGRVDGPRKLPVTFAVDEAQLLRIPTVTGLTATTGE